MQRTINAYNRVAFRAETQYRLNHITLNSRDQRLKKEVKKFKIDLIEIMYPGMLIAVTFVFMWNLFNNFVRKKGHPLSSISAGF